MPENMSAETLLEQEYLPTRAKILEIAATLDRVARGDERLSSDPRVKQLRSALEMLLDDQSDRAARIQLLFSRPYDENWSDTLHMPKR
ncbi:hypothetical protein [Bythopirellula goksoeyrii]|uniref:Uncharacterized protein n=1 Tax=Bythopirellula goksoeyrii TaxID=1400387 RepID=A0A5B9QNU6_9BACT|nr:hypothetical protein [Bythopirellula goksoeyrii]QEG35663.1 hypothetical protein Pr1d_29650 [Bythopirellula goksoeyrii]